MPNKRMERTIMSTPFADSPFICGALRQPRQMLAEQVYDGHRSIHDDAMTRRCSLARRRSVRYTGTGLCLSLHSRPFVSIELRFVAGQFNDV